MVKVVTQVLPILQSAFASCIGWFSQLIDAVGGTGVLLGAFTLVLVVGMFLIPLRGEAIYRGASSFMDFTSGVIHNRKGKYSKPRQSSDQYKGKYEKRSHGGHRATPKK